MQFAPPRHRRAAEPIVPMINVVFLLLIFFLISAQIAPPAPFDITLPESASAGDRAAPADTLYMDAEGRLAFNAARGDAVLDALAARATPGAPLQIRADTGVEARALARLLPRLAARGIAEVEIVTGARR